MNEAEQNNRIEKHIDWLVVTLFSSLRCGYATGLAALCGAQHHRTVTSIYTAVSSQEVAATSSV